MLLLMQFNAMCKIYENADPYFLVYRSGHQRLSVNKGVLRNFAKFTGKHHEFIKMRL